MRSMEKKHDMIRSPVIAMRVAKEDVVRFVEAVSCFENFMTAGQVGLSINPHTIDSFNYLDLERPFLLVIHGYVSKQKLKILDEWRVDDD